MTVIIIVWCVKDSGKGEIEREKEKRQEEEMCYTKLTNVTKLVRQNHMRVSLQWTDLDYNERCLGAREGRDTSREEDGGEKTTERLY